MSVFRLAARGAAKVMRELRSGELGGARAAVVGEEARAVSMQTQLEARLLLEQGPEAPQWTRTEGAQREVVAPEV